MNPLPGQKPRRTRRRVVSIGLLLVLLGAGIYLTRAPLAKLQLDRSARATAEELNLDSPTLIETKSECFKKQQVFTRYAFCAITKVFVFEARVEEGTALLEPVIEGQDPREYPSWKVLNRAGEQIQPIEAGYHVAYPEMVGYDPANPRSFSGEAESESESGFGGWRAQTSHTWEREIAGRFYADRALQWLEDGDGEAPILIFFSKQYCHNAPIPFTGHLCLLPG